MDNFEFLRYEDNDKAMNQTTHVFGVINRLQ